MVSTIGVDWTIEEVELYAGKARPFYINEIDDIPSAAYRHVHLPDVTFNGFPLGLDTVTVRRLFGKPRQIDHSKGKTIYQYYFKYGDEHVPINELPPSARFDFHNDSLISVDCEESD
jgi:hypothetical protein